MTENMFYAKIMVVYSGYIIIVDCFIRNLGYDSRKYRRNKVACSRYKRNCSILKNAKSGRIQDEICDFECSKYKEINK